MHEKEFGFPFLEIPVRPPKPRKQWVTVMSDRSIPLGYQRDFLHMNSDMIDYVKFVDHPNNMVGHPRELIEEKIAIYKEFSIPCFLGGIPFEVSVLQGKVDAFLKRVKELGLQAVEISEDVIPTPLTLSDREAYIKQAADMGLEVFTEMGRKFPDKPLELQEAVASIQWDLEAGVKMVVIENSEILQLIKDGSPLLIELSKEIDNERLIFEAGPNDWSKAAAWLIRNIGSEVNIENVYDNNIVTLDAMRRLLNRGTEYAFFQKDAS